MRGGGAGGPWVNLKSIYWRAEEPVAIFRSTVLWTVELPQVCHYIFVKAAGRIISADSSSRTFQLYAGNEIFSIGYVPARGTADIEARHHISRYQDTPMKIELTTDSLPTAVAAGTELTVELFGIPDPE